tara:strand:+ start:523 stop:753 length:231 start_codon:yes stop_codon:yes gene_type:complete
MCRVVCIYVLKYKVRKRNKGSRAIKENVEEEGKRVKKGMKGARIYIKVLHKGNIRPNNPSSLLNTVRRGVLQELLA